MIPVILSAVFCASVPALDAGPPSKPLPPVLSIPRGEIPVDVRPIPATPKPDNRK